MDGKTAKIASLRTSLAGLVEPEECARISLGCRSVDLLLKGGIRRGALHEIFASPGHEAAATGFALALALRISGSKRLLWIQRDFSALEHGELAATGLLEMGANPARVLLLRAAHDTDALRAAGDALSSAALGAVLIETSGEPRILDLVTSRRLTLASARLGVTALLLRFNADLEASAAETRWLVRGAGSSFERENWGNPVFAADLVRNRHGGTGHFVLEWNCDDNVFRERAADCGAVVSAPSDRPAAAASA